MKKRILWHSDSPTCATGFGNVARSLLAELYDPEQWELTVIGINHAGEPYSTKDYPYLEPNGHNTGLWPAMDNGGMFAMYGMNKVVQFAQTGTYDVLFILQDPFILGLYLPKLLEVREKLEKKFKIIFYFPIDVAPIRDSWAADVVSKIDFPVAYTEFGRREIQRVCPDLAMDVINHGLDTDLYKPIIGEARTMIRKMVFPQVPDDWFLVMNVNRNQPRKDLARTFEAFAKFHKKNPKSFLYIHAAKEDAGGNMEEIADHFGLQVGKDWSYPDPRVFTPNKGLPLEMMPQIYACADLMVSTTLGEGHGLSMTESMGCGIPVLFPRNSSMIEIIGENEERGSHIKCGGPDHTICLGPQDNSRLRPVVHIDDMAEKMLNIWRYPQKYQRKAALALSWVREHTWKQMAEKWKEVFNRAFS